MTRIRHDVGDDTNAPVTTFASFKGLVNTVNIGQLAPDELAVALNVDLTDRGTLRRRKGFINKISLAMENLWAENDIALFSSAGNMYRLNPDYTYAVLASGITPGARMSYASVNKVVYHANGLQMAAYQNGVIRTWGLRNPATQPAAAPAMGILPAGVYQYAVTFERGDGQESGTGMAGSVSLPNDSGIYFTNIPVSADPSVYKIRLYLSPQNGDMLYYVASIPNGVTTYSYLNGGADLGTPLRTQFKTRPPVGTDLAVYNGRMYIANKNFLHCTLPFNYELADLREYMDFGAPITLVAVVSDGLFVATADQTMFLSGNEYGAFTQEVVAPYGAIPGTLTYAEGALFGEGATRGVVPVWESVRGKCFGGAGGVFTNLTQARYLYPSAPTGASIVLQLNGLNQHVSVLHG